MTKNGWPSTAPLGSSHRTGATRHPSSCAACIIRNSSTLVEPNTPPCSTRTTYRAPSDISAYQLARELPVAIRRNWITSTSPSRRSASQRCNGARIASSIEPPSKGVDERGRLCQLVVELPHEYWPQRVNCLLRRLVTTPDGHRQHRSGGVHHCPL